MAFTNYLMHSVVLTTIFYGYGFGLYGQVPRFWQMAICGSAAWLPVVVQSLLAQQVPVRACRVVLAFAYLLAAATDATLI